MKFVPNTTCRRCHRQYPSFRGSCPYCGTKKAKEVKSATPETDSAIPGTRAARSAAESLNWQMLIGGVLLVAVIAVTTIMVSVNVGNDAEEQQMIADQLAMQQAEITPLPAPTATPEPTPTPPPAITRVSVYLGEWTQYDYVDNGFSEQKGDEFKFQAAWFPNDVAAEPQWYAEDEGVVELEPDGNYCTVRLIGEPGTGTNIHVVVNNMDKKFACYINGVAEGFE